MNVNQTIKAWKNPKFRSDTNMENPVGKSFQEMDLQEMSFVTGGNGEADPDATPTTITTVTTLSKGGLISGAVSAVSGLVSYTKKCI